ncbi:MAG: phosphatidylserine decarboxylase [Acetobacteraceae bacterium]|nr:phosphatidylserine decarboxylase [Acetobacteraceae bacterium]
MTGIRRAVRLFARGETVNFLLTNRIPRRFATQFFGRFSRIENPVVRTLSIGAWRLFADLDLSDARDKRFRSLHHCFVRKLRDEARPADADPDLLVSPCDAIVGECGSIENTTLLQVKGSSYQLHELLGEGDDGHEYRNGCYATLRLTSSMYHRFHAPHDCRIESVTYIPGDTWNVNPPALKRVEHLFCKNERAVIKTQMSGHPVAIVPVAAILVAGIRFSFMETDFDLRRGGARTIRLDQPLRKGQEMGWFEHGSTILVFAPSGFSLCETVRDGTRIRAGQPLMRLPERTESSAIRDDPSGKAG